MTPRLDRARAPTATRRGRGRKTRVAACLAVTVAAAVLVAPPAAADTTGPAIVHVPVTTAPYGQPVPISLTTTCATGAACSALLYYRATAPAALTAIPGVINEGGFQVLPLTRGATTTVEGREAVEWSGAVPASAVTTTGVDYFLEADHDGALTRFPGTTYANGTQPSGSYLHVQVLSPPLLNHVPVPLGVADQPITVDAQVSCSSGNCQATLWYRRTLRTPTSQESWSSVAMAQQGAGTSLGGAAVLLAYQAQVPGSSVDTRGVDYYLHVTDGHTQAFHPGTVYEGYYAPRDGARDPAAFHHVHVLEPPRVAHIPVTTAPYRQDVPVSARANCPSTRQCQATLYYRTTVPGAVNGGGFSSTAMTVTPTIGAGGVDAVAVDGAIPAAAVDTRGVDYYFSVTDGTTTSWWPGTSAADGPGVWVDGVWVVYHHVHVQEPPHLAHVPPTVAPALEDLAVETELTCATEACSADLVWTTTPNTPDSYQTTAMGRVSVRATTSATRVELWRATIPASAVTTRGLAYYMTATDGYTHTAAPGTSYWGAYLPLDGSNPAPGTARFVVRVVDPPHPVHVPVGVAYTGEAVAIEARSNCATPACPATLHWRVTGQGWQSTPMAASAPTPLAYGNDLVAYTATIAGANVTTAGVEYRIEVTDGYVTQTTPTYPVAVTDRPAPGSVGTAVVFVPPAAQGPVDSDVPLAAEATWADGSPYSGPVKWCATAPASTSTGCTSSGTATSTGGTVVFVVRPTTAYPQLRVTAWADTMTAGVQDPTEATGAAAVVGITPPAPPEVTTLAFTPPVAQAGQGTSVDLAFTARKGDGSPFAGVVRWGAGPPGAPSYTNSTTTDGAGNGSVTATPTASAPVVQVTAYADSASGAQDASETPGAATVVGTPPPPGPPQATTVAFVPPVAQATPGSSVAMPFTARKGDGSPFAGVVRWGAGPPGAPSYTNSTTTDGAGNGSVTATPTASAPVVQVTAYADSASGGQYGAQDPAEATGTAAAVGTPPPGTVGTTVAFTPPVAQTAQGSAVTMGFAARNTDGSPFVGTVRWGSGPAGSTPAFGSTTTTNAAGNGTVTVTPTAGTPVVQVLAYADRAGAGFGAQDPTEATGAAAALGSPPPPSPSQVTTVAFVPPVAQTPQGSSATLSFTARRGDGTPFAGAVRWGAGPPGAPSFPNLATTDASGNGSVTATPTAATPVVQVVAFADNAGSGSGVQDPGELPGAAAAVGTTAVTPPTGTTLAFVPPVAQTPQGTAVTLAFTARNLDGSPFVGTVRWGSGSAGSTPAYGSTATTNSSGSGSVTVTSTAATPAVQVLAYADRSGAGFATQDQTEAAGAAGVVGAPSVTPTVPSGTGLVFSPPVAHGQTGSAVTLAFTARNLDGSPFVGAVRWGSGPAGSIPSYGSATTTDAAGNGSVTVTPTPAAPALQVVAYADRSGAGFGAQDPTEASGFGAAVGDTAPPPPAPGTEVVFTTPVWTAQYGAREWMAFTARRHDGSPFTGTVFYGSAPAGTTPELTSSTTTNANGDGFAAVPAGSSPVQVVAYADRADVESPGTRDHTEVPGTAVLVGADL